MGSYLSLRDARLRGAAWALCWVLSLGGVATQANAQTAAEAVPSADDAELDNDPQIRQLANMLSGIKDPSPDAPKPSSDPRNLSGIYIASKLQPDIGRRPFLMVESTRMSVYRSPYQELAEKRLALKKNKLSVEPPSFNCRPFFNIGYMSLALFPVRIVQTRDRVVVLVEEGRGVWEIFMNQSPPQHIEPTYNGYSVGHWEGDTLVVDVTGFNGKQWIDQLAGPNSTQASVKVWIRKIDAGRKLDIRYQISDPQLYAEPPALRHFTIDWNPELRMQEFICEESVDVGSYTGITEDH